MELKPGYKLTEVGVIPHDWNTASLLAVADCLDNVRVPLNEAQRQRMQGDIPYCGANGVLDYVSDFVIDDDIILMAEDGGYFDQYASRPIAYRMKGKCWVNNHAHILRAKSGYDQGFLFFSLVHKNILPFLASGTRAKLNKSELEKIVVPAPAAEAEQRNIAAALSDVEALLGGLDRLIAKKRNLKQAAMQQLLTGKTRLPGFHGEWDQVLLGELFRFKNGLNKSKEYFGYGTPIVNYMDVFSSSALYSSRLEGRVSLSAPELTHFDVHKGDVFFTRTSETTEEVGIASVMLDEPTETVFSGFVLRARPVDDRLADCFKAYCFSTESVRKQITSKASYTTRALTNGRILSEVRLPLPTRPEQIAIAAVLSDMDAELAAVEARRDKTRGLKQAMMQELLIGRTRLVPAGVAHA